MSKAIQCVVRTGVQKQSYEYRNEYEHTIEDLEKKLAEGYTVVMCNKITREEKEWLEYILQKEVEGQTELEDMYARGYKAGRSDQYNEITSQYLLLTNDQVDNIEAFAESNGITRVLSILVEIDKQILEKVKDKLYEQDYNEQKEQEE